MPIEGVFHLSHFVDDLPEAMAFYEAVFGPHVFYRGYEPNYHRDGALFAVSEFIIEALQPLGPTAEKPEQTSLNRYLERFGSRVHSMAFYASDLAATTAVAAKGGVRIIDEGATIFTHPKDFPGMVELFDPEVAGGSLPDPRRTPGWSSRWWAERHPLGMLRASHVTLVVADHREAAKRYQEAFAAVVLPDQAASTAGGTATFVALGNETVVELLEPTDGTCVHAAALAQVGATYTGATFLVADLAAAEAHLARLGIATTRPAHDLVQIDPATSMGAVYAFTDRRLLGDGRDGAAWRVVGA